MSMARADEVLDEAAALMRRMEDIPDTIMREVAIMAFRHTRYRLLDFLMANFRASGIGQKSAEEYRATGQLERAIRQTQFAFVWNNGRPFIRMSMPANVGKYKSGASVHVVAASLNFGAVRAPLKERDVVDLPTGHRTRRVEAVLGERAKRSLKRFALGGGQSKRERSSLENGRKSRDGRVIMEPVKLGNIHVYSKSVKIETDQGDVVVIRPRRFFYISETQREQFEAEFTAMISNFLDNALGGAA